MARKKKKRLKIKKKKSLLSILASKYFWLSLFFLAVLSGLFYFFILSSFFQIKEVSISGNKEVAENNVSLLVEKKLERRISFKGFTLFSSKSILLFSPGRTSSLIENSLPRIKEARVKRKLPDTVEVKIEERSLFKEVCMEDGNCFGVDKEGIAFEKSAGIKENTEEDIMAFQVEEAGPLLTIEGGGIRLGEEAIDPFHLARIDELVQRIENDFSFRIKKMTVTTEDTLLAATDEEFLIYFDLTSSVDDQLSNLELVLREKVSEEKRKDLEYIDLRFGNRVYYK